MYQPNFRFLNLQFQICIKILQFPLCWLAFASVYVYTMVCQSSLLKNSWICLLSILRKEPLEGLYFILVSCKYIFHACWSSRVDLDLRERRKEVFNHIFAKMSPYTFSFMNKVFVLLGAKCTKKVNWSLGNTEGKPERTTW